VDKPLDGTLASRSQRAAIWFPLQGRQRGEDIQFTDLREQASDSLQCCPQHAGLRRRKE
jgi:hypothetical protein